MTLDQALSWLQSIKQKHGGDIEIYFDCDNCKQSYTPSKIVTSAVHVSSEKK